jgi:hypothetical protein
VRRVVFSVAHATDAERVDEVTFDTRAVLTDSASGAWMPAFGMARDGEKRRTRLVQALSVAKEAAREPSGASRGRGRVGRGSPSGRRTGAQI